MANTALGPAAKGSRYCLQRYLRLKPRELGEQLISASPALMAFGPTRVDWKSPLEDSRYQEHRDDFLEVLGFRQLEEALRDFWPWKGPQWDALGLLPTDGATGILLVEAKAHPTETESTCGATSPASIEKIGTALAQVQAHMQIAAGVTPSDWMRGSYQLANRLAFLYFLNEVANVPTFLALVNFVDDQSHRPTELTEWRQHQQGVLRSLGIHSRCRMLDRLITLFPQALPTAPDTCLTI
jgi:hypothetical protein